MNPGEEANRMRSKDRNMRKRANKTQTPRIANNYMFLKSRPIGYQFIKFCMYPLKDLQRIHSVSTKQFLKLIHFHTFSFSELSTISSLDCWADPALVNWMFFFAQGHLVRRFKWVCSCTLIVPADSQKRLKQVTARSQEDKPQPHILLYQCNLMADANVGSIEANKYLHEHEI